MKRLSRLRPSRSTADRSRPGPARHKARTRPASTAKSPALQRTWTPGGPPAAAYLCRGPASSARCCVFGGRCWLRGWRGRRRGGGARGRPGLSRSAIRPCVRSVTWWLMGWSRGVRVAAARSFLGRPRGRGGSSMRGAGRGVSVW